MGNNEFLLVYNVADEGIWGRLGFVLFLTIIGLTIGSTVLYLCWRARRIPGIVGGIIFIGVWICAGIGGFAGVAMQQWICISHARNGEFKVVEGPIKDFQPEPEGGHGKGSFRVENVRFEYSRYELSKGGFSGTGANIDQFREGAYARVTYFDGRILKLEVRK